LRHSVFFVLDRAKYIVLITKDDIWIHKEQKILTESVKRELVSLTGQKPSRRSLPAGASVFPVETGTANCERDGKAVAR